MGHRAIIILVVAVLVAGGCGPNVHNTTALSDDDLTHVVNQTRAKLAAAPFLADRKPDSPPVRITIDKVENETLDRIDEAKQWMFVLKVTQSLPIQSFATEKNITFQVSPERLERLRAMGYQGAGSAYAPPTHVLKAVFKSSVDTRDNKEGFVNSRSDQYYLEYYIVDLSTNSMVWDSAVEFRRKALGVSID